MLQGHEELAAVSQCVRLLQEVLETRVKELEASPPSLQYLLEMLEGICIEWAR